MKLVPVYGVVLRRDSSVRVADKRADTPSSAVAILRAHIGEADREHFVALYLSARNLIIGVHTVSIGTLTASLVHPREAFKAGILLGAAGLIAAHNHPSGDPAPSPEDREATRRLQRAGELLGIPVLDHLIIGRESYFSFRESGLI
jgi:DNA repair protein RadC